MSVLRQRGGRVFLNLRGGAAFDRDYVRSQVDYQNANVALYQYEIANGSDADLVPFARETLPKIQDPLAKALALEPNAGH